MILVLLASIMSATADPDYFAVKIKSGRFKIFSKISECTGAVYQSGDNKVLFRDGVWKIGTLKNGLLDCKKLSSVVAEEFQTKETQIPKNELWIDIKKSEQNWIFNNLIEISIEGIDNSVEKEKMKLVGGKKIEAESQEDCLKEDLKKKYPNKDIVVAYKDSNCSYSFVDEAELEYDAEAIMFVYHSGKYGICL